MPANNRLQRNLTIVSANVRGLQTNIGDLTHSHVLQHNPDIIATVETFLNSSIPENFGQINGYSRWHRRDRVQGTFGGIAVCFRRGLAVQALNVEMPEHLELMFFKLWTHNQDAILLCVCYRPQWQGNEPIHYLHTNLDTLLHQHACEHLIILGDMNQHLVARSFDEMLTVFGLSNHVDFPTHISGSSLDPVISDLPDGVISCRSLGAVGSSDHLAILTTIKVLADRDEAVIRTNWLWDRGNWDGLRGDLENISWTDVLTGSIDDQVGIISDLLLTLQHRYIPCQTYKSKPQDQPWFGFHCRVAADKKSRAWQRYRAHPSRLNKNLHKLACKNMDQVQKWAIHRWREDLKSKLSGQSVGSKTWWSSIKQHQGLVNDDCIPPLTRPDGTVATRDRDKAQVLAAHFSSKMTVPDPERVPPIVPEQTKATLGKLTFTAEDVRKQLLRVNPKKALGLDDISPRLLKVCANQLAGPLTMIFQESLSTRKWPSLWKGARVVAIHKKSSRADPKNYRPISLLSVLNKVFETLITDKLTSFLDAHHLINLKQFGFRRNRSTADLLLLQSATWNHSLDSGKDTFVIALDIAGAFDRVWHQGIITKLRSLGVCGDLLQLLQDYLYGRTMQVVVNGHTSSEFPVNASVPQGSVLGPLLWNIYFNDILQLIPEAYAYADDCTLTFTCDRTNRQATIARINQALQSIISWGKRWQVTLAPEKTQVMLISRRQDLATAAPVDIQLDGRRLPLQGSVTILGVEFDNHLTFTNHVRQVAKDAAWKLGCIRRIAHLLDDRGVVSLYKAQVRSLMEYAHLVWSSCPPSYLSLLDRVQNRAYRLAQLRARDPGPGVSGFQSLQQRRDVAGLCVMYKVHKLHTPHLTPLRLDPPPTPVHATRGTRNRDHQLTVPFARTEYFLRSFIPRYSRLWNNLVECTDLHQITTLHLFKTQINIWLQT